MHSDSPAKLGSTHPFQLKDTLGKHAQSYNNRRDEGERSVNFTEADCGFP
jgi:hypothetical protein